MKDGQRIVMREGPCMSCPPWTRKFVGKGYKGKIVSWTDLSHSYWVAFDQLPGETTGVCARHMTTDEEQKKKPS